MMDKKQFIESQKDCASMLGMSLKEYEKTCANLKIPSSKKIKSKNYDNSILKHLGLDVSDLKMRKEI